MSKLLKISAFWLIFVLAAPAGAQDSAPPSGPPDEASPTAPADGAIALPEERRWRLGAAFGYGARSNPLVQSKDIPVLIDLDIAYFGDRWFFDNGDLGVQLLDNRVFTTNLVARVNSDRAFFSKTNTKYVSYSLVGNGFTSGTNPVTGELITEPQPLKPPKRKYAVEAGLETLFSGEWGQATLHAFHDVSGTHDGYEIAADYSYRITRGRLALSPRIGMSWKSANLSDYYWGVHADEVSATLARHEVRGGLGWEAGLNANYYLTKSTRLAVAVNYERLHYGIAQSPLVRQDYVFGYFAGLAWQF